MRPPQIERRFRVRNRIERTILMAVASLGMGMLGCSDLDRAKLAAVFGGPEASVRVAEMYANGEGVDTDLAEAASWYRKAAEVEHVEAQYQLGVLHRSGRGVDKNHRTAFRWFEAAATAGSAFRYTR